MSDFLDNTEDIGNNIFIQKTGQGLKITKPDYSNFTLVQIEEILNSLSDSNFKNELIEISKKIISLKLSVYYTMEKLRKEYDFIEEESNDVIVDKVCGIFFLKELIDVYDPNFEYKNNIIEAYISTMFKKESKNEKNELLRYLEKLSGRENNFKRPT